MSKKSVRRVRYCEGHKCNYGKGFTLDVVNHSTTPPCVVHQVDVNVGVITCVCNGVAHQVDDVDLHGE